MKTIVLYLISSLCLAQSATKTPFPIPTALYTPAPTLTPIPLKSISYVYLQSIPSGFEIVDSKGNVLKTLNALTKPDALREAYSIYPFLTILMVFKPDAAPTYTIVGGNIQ